MLNLSQTDVVCKQRHGENSAPGCEWLCVALDVVLALGVLVWFSGFSLVLPLITYVADGVVCGAVRKYKLRVSVCSAYFLAAFVV